MKYLGQRVRSYVSTCFEKTTSVMRQLLFFNDRLMLSPQLLFVMKKNRILGTLFVWDKRCLVTCDTFLLF